MVRHLTTWRFRTRAPLALALACAALAESGTARAQPSDSPPVVFFWSSASQADVSARATLVPAVEAAARGAGAQAVDLSPVAAPSLALTESVTRGVASYDAMRFADAVAELDLVAAAAAEHGARGLTRDALVDLFLFRALAKNEMGDATGAWSDFVRAATLDPARVLDPARFRPSAVKSFARAVQEVTARGTAPLTVRAPAGSRVYLDGRATGRDQATDALLPGEHFVWVERPAAPPFARTVTLATATEIDVPDDAAAPPVDADLVRRATRLGAGAVLLVALRRDGGVALVELRSVGGRRQAMRGVVRLGPSPEADARDLRAEVARALEQVERARPVITTPAGGETERRWYHSRWLWVAVGAVSAFAVMTPFLLDTGDSSRGGAALDTGELEQ